MKPVDRVAVLSRLAFRPDDQPGLFNRGGPMVVLLSDVQKHVGELQAELTESDCNLRRTRREITELRRGGAGANVRKRPIKHLFVDQLSVPEHERIKRVCARYRADYGAVVVAARLYSETNGVKYASWPAAIEVALANDYQWLRGARQPKATQPSVGEYQPTEKQLAARKLVEDARARRGET